MRFLLLVAGCLDGTLSIPTTETGSGADADTDADVDSDTDTDADTDTAQGCPFAGSWTVERVDRDGGSDTWIEMGVVGTVEVTGSPEECVFVFDVVVDDEFSADCHIVETVTLDLLFETTWEGWSDGGQYPACRNSALGARAVGPITIEGDDSRLVMVVDGGIDNYLQIVAWQNDHRVTLTRAAAGP